MALIGYARVSTGDQNTEAQHRALTDAGCERVFTDHATSGKTTSRPELDRMLEHLRSGDQVIVWKLDRLGRDTRHLLELLERFHAEGVSFRSIHDGITTDPSGGTMARAMAEAMLTIISAFSKLERDQISERTKAGLETARAHGRVGGRPVVEADHPDVLRAKELHSKGFSASDIGKHLARDVKRKDGITERNVPLSRATVYRYLSM